MPETEFFKVVLQGGSFALIVLLVVWALFWFWPMIDKRLATITDGHERIMIALVSGQADQMKAVAESQTDQMKQLISDHQATIRAMIQTHNQVLADVLEKDRKERTEILDRAAAEAAADREARHRQVNTFQRILAKQSEESGPDNG